VALAHEVYAAQALETTLKPKFLTCSEECWSKRGM
jgi:hypothetical protein